MVEVADSFPVILLVQCLFFCSSRVHGIRGLPYDGFFVFSVLPGADDAQVVYGRNVIAGHHIRPISHRLSRRIDSCWSHRFDSYPSSRS